MLLSQFFFIWFGEIQWTTCLIIGLRRQRSVHCLFTEPFLGDISNHVFYSWTSNLFKSLASWHMALFSFRAWSTTSSTASPTWACWACWGPQRAPGYPRTSSGVPTHWCPPTTSPCWSSWSCTRPRTRPLWLGQSDATAGYSSYERAGDSFFLSEL